MNTSRMRLLLNAEPFGFGPTAAIAAMMPHLRAHFSNIGYAGTGHTLDLQKNLPYDQVHDIGGLPPEKLGAVLSGYDVLLTASDFGMAEAARRQGLKVCIYDPLTWYWPEIPAAAKQADLYIAQDFYGVRERIAAEFNSLAKCEVVPPIIRPVADEKPRGHILINLGGLQNPFWAVEDAARYAGSLLDCLRAAIPATEKIIVATSRAIAEKLTDPDAKTYSVEEMADLRQRSKVAFMTPGLGNIFDAAADNVPTVWLPPANDSQGQQADIIRARNLCDAIIDWADLSPGLGINYKSPQPAVLAHITATVRQFAVSPLLQQEFSRLAGKACRDIAGRPHSAAQALLKQFGENGASAAAKSVVRYCLRLDADGAIHA